MSKPESTREQIAARLKTAREAAGLSQGQVAKLLKMHRPDHFGNRGGKAAGGGRGTGGVCELCTESASNGLPPRPRSPTRVRTAYFSPRASYPR